MPTRRDILRKAGVAGSLIAIPGTAGSIASSRAEAGVCEVPADDPALAVIANFQRARAAWLDADDAMTDEEMSEACRQECRAAIAMLTCQPTTMAGLLAFVETIVAVQAEDDGALGPLADWTPIVPLQLDAPNAEEMFLATLLASVRGLAQGGRC